MVASRQIIMTPGVYFLETDISQYVRDLTQNHLALVGVAQKGPVDQNLLITSLQQGIDTLGIPGEDYPALLVMREFFNAGGGRLNFVRVAREDVTAATDVTLIDASTASVEGKTTGSFFNNISVGISYAQTAAFTEVSASHTFASGSGTYSYTLTELPLVPGTVTIKFGSTTVATDNSAGAFTFVSGYSAYSGTVNYLTGAISIVTTSLGADNATTVKTNGEKYTTFSIQVKYTVKDNDGNALETYVMESFPNVTLSTMEARLANSKHIALPDGAFDHFPVAGTYSLADGDDGKDTILDSDFIGNTVSGTPTGMQIFAYPDKIDINILMVPGKSSSLAVRQAMQQLVEVSRFDTLAVITPPADATIQGAADWINGNGSYGSYNTVDSTYMAAYFPHYTTYNAITNENELTPPDALAAAAFARSMSWEAPAGPNRGKALNIIDIAVDLNQSDRAFLGENRINPISDLNGMGVMVLGQQTATLTASSLDRIGARMMLMRIEKAVTTALYPLLFEPNDQYTWNRATNIVQPYLKALKKQGRIYDGLFVCDATTNTDDIIEQNIMAAQCRLKLLKYAEIIVVNFIVMKTGANITENVVSVKTV